MKTIRKITDLLNPQYLLNNRAINFLNKKDGIEILENKPPRGHLVDPNIDIPDNWRTVTFKYVNNELQCFLELKRDDA